MNWILVEDRLPDKAGYYMVCWEYESSIVPGEVWYEPEEWIFPNYGGDEKENLPTQPTVLCWMNIPLPPRELAERMGT